MGRSSDRRSAGAGWPSKRRRRGGGEETAGRCGGGGERKREVGERERKIRREGGLASPRMQELPLQLPSKAP